MYATAEQVGEQLLCPDCGTRTLVRPPPPPPKKTSADFRVAPTEEYAVQESLGQPPPGAVAYQPHVGFKCRRCGTRLHATLDQVGQPLECPD
jgi:DNA-directed RNA polymerase subunit RPC12/RpoP